MTKKQYVFRKEKSAANAIFALRMVTVRTIDMQKALYMRFIGYEKKTFDIDGQEGMNNMVKCIEQMTENLKLISTWYSDQIAVVKIGNENTVSRDSQRNGTGMCAITKSMFYLYGADGKLQMVF